MSSLGGNGGYLDDRYGYIDRLVPAEYRDWAEASRRPPAATSSTTTSWAVRPRPEVALLLALRLHMCGPDRSPDRRGELDGVLIWCAVAATATNVATVATDTWNAASSAATDAWNTGTEAARAILRDALYTTGDVLGAINDTVANFALGVARQTAYDIASVDGKVQSGDYLGAFVDLYAGLVLATGGGPLMGMATKAAMAVARPVLGRLVGPLMSGASRLLSRVLARGTTERWRPRARSFSVSPSSRRTSERNYWWTQLTEQRIAAAGNPGLESAYIATNIHEATVARLRQLYGNRFAYFRTGVDFYDTETTTFVELTTQKALSKHVAQYAPQLWHPINGEAIDVIEFMPYVLKP